MQTRRVFIYSMNYMKHAILTATFLVLLLCAFGQRKFTLHGYIRDSASGEALIGASLSILKKSESTVSNQYGFYSITLDSGQHEILCTYVGYQPQIISVNLISNTQSNILLGSYSADIENVTVTSTKKESNIKGAQMGKLDLTMNTVKALPAILGETDILKTIQLMPGVRNAGEGNSGFYVRGGGPDQNLIMLDDAVVYNTGHLFGFFSVFNSDAIKSLSLIKGGMPAQYGGRLASVVDVSMKEGNLNKMEVDAGIGLIASRFSIQGPIKKQKSSFMVSARRTYLDLLIKPFISKSSSFYGSGYYFYDLNAKMNFIFSPKDRLYVSGYFGRDVFNYENRKRSFNINVPWGNATATLRWNHVFNRKMFANTTVVYSDYKFEFAGEQNDFLVKLSSGIKDVNIKLDVDYYPSPAHKIKFGGLSTFHTFLPNVASGSQDTVTFTPNNAVKKYANEAAIYIQDEWDISRKFRVNAGLRYSRFMQLGRYTSYTRDDNGNKLDSTVYGRGEVVKSYGGFEPRFTLRYAIDDVSSLKAGITRNLQYIHLVSNSGTTLPTDIWVPSTYRVKPQTGWQYALGYFRNFNNSMFETSMEVYYKNMENQIEYKEGYTPNFNDVEESFVFGKGWAYGTELFVHKLKGRLTGWVGYTLSWTWRKFSDLNSGDTYPGKYDRRHDLSVVAMYELNKKWKFSSVFVFGTGNAISLPERFYFVEGTLTQEYSRINAYRMEPYHRLDLSATYTPHPEKQKKFKTNWVFSVYNAYSRLNPYFYYFDQEGSVTNGNLTVTAKKVALFPIIPAVTWNVKF